MIALVHFFRGLSLYLKAPRLEVAIRTFSLIAFRFRKIAAYEIHNAVILQAVELAERILLFQSFS